MLVAAALELRLLLRGMDAGSGSPISEVAVLLRLLVVELSEGSTDNRVERRVAMMVRYNFQQ